LEDYSAELEQKRSADKKLGCVFVGDVNKLFEEKAAEALRKIKRQYSRMTMTCSSFEALVKIGESNDTSHE
jgi:hypothetical protein